jgi:hypothetical protein
MNLPETATVVVAGAGTLGTALAKRLEGKRPVRLASDAELTATPSTEVAFAGAHTIVHLARVGTPVARLPRATPDDLELLIADTVARSAKLVGARHLIHFANGPDDARVPLLEKSGVTLSVLRGGGPDAAVALEKMIDAPGHVEGPAWTPAERDAAKPPRFGTCSVQRYRRPAAWNAYDVARAYFRWLPSDVPLVRTAELEGVFTIFTAGVRTLVLRHVAGRSSEDLAWFEIADGALRGAGQRHGHARFEFRNLLDGAHTLAAMIDFTPALPFPLYRFTQAALHERVMRRFGDWLSAQSGAPPS